MPLQPIVPAEVKSYLRAAMEKYDVDWDSLTSEQQEEALKGFVIYLEAVVNYILAKAVVPAITPGTGVTKVT